MVKTVSKLKVGNVFEQDGVIYLATQSDGFSNVSAITIYTVNNENLGNSRMFHFTETVDFLADDVEDYSNRAFERGQMNIIENQF